MKMKFNGIFPMFYDLGSQLRKTVTHKYKNPGYYTVTLLVSNPVSSMMINNQVFCSFNLFKFIIKIFILDLS